MPKDTLAVCVLVSGSGTNLQAIIDATKRGELHINLACVISSRPDAYALTRARQAGIRTEIIDWKSLKKAQANQKLYSVLTGLSPDLIVLAGFMHILPDSIVAAFRGRIINTHPALLPSFSGKGFYGDRVHRAVLQRGVRVSGCTIHFVDEGVDTGPIILQEAVPVFSDDTVETLRERVKTREHHLLPEAIKLFCEGRLCVDSGRVRIEPR